MIRGLGYIHDDAPGNWPVGELFGAVSDGPPAFDRSGLLDGRILDQRDSGSCVGHAVSRAIQLRLRAAGHLDAELPCVLAVYALARVHQGMRVGRHLPDAGSTITAAVESIIEHGFARESVWPWDPDLVREMPPWDVVQAQWDQRGIRAHRLVQTGDQRCVAIRAALVLGCGVALGLDADQSLMDLRGDGVWTGMTSPRLGGHAMAALDYDEQALRVVNSWGDDWGASGLGRIAWEYIASESTRSVWIIDVAGAYSG